MVGVTPNSDNPPTHDMGVRGDIRRSTSDQPLDGLVVIDLSEGVAGPYCTKLFAGFGARVVKLELPRGDPARWRGPFRNGHADPEASGLFLHLNAGKNSAVVDYERPEGAGIVRDLLGSADVLVESFRPGKLADLGLEPKAIMEAHPALVLCSVTAFGQTGPRRNEVMTSITTFAMAGPMNSSGSALREPVKQAGNVIEYQAGNTAFAATLGAIFWSLQTGHGQHVDISNLETQAGSTDRVRAYHLAYQYTGTVVQRDRMIGRIHGGVGGRFTAADGTVVTPGMRVWPTHIERMVSVLDDARVTALLNDEGPQAVSSAGELVNGVIADWVGNRTGRQAMREAQAQGWPMVVVNDPLSVLSDQHLEARGFWRKADHPVAGLLPYAGAPWRVDGGGWDQITTAPVLGQDTDPVLGELAGYSSEKIADLRAAGMIK
jgi:CoA:oxalate CoA-transferase